MTETHHYDVSIVGGGPAGCAAALFCGRAGLETVLVANGRSTLQKCAYVENYLGFPAGSSREHHSRWHENTSNNPRVRSKMEPSRPSPRRTGRSGSNSTARRSMPTTFSWPRGPIATSSRRSAPKPNGNRTARSGRSLRTGKVELASTDSGRRDASPAPTTRRSSVRGRAHGSP